MSQSGVHSRAVICRETSDGRMPRVHRRTDEGRPVGGRGRCLDMVLTWPPNAAPRCGCRRFLKKAPVCQAKLVAVASERSKPEAPIDSPSGNEYYG